MNKDRQALDNGWIMLTAWAEPCSGPGWTNSIIWVLIQKPETGELCLESIQPEEQTPTIQALFNVSFASSDAMTKATIGLINKRLLLSRGEKMDNYRDRLMAGEPRAMAHEYGHLGALVKACQERDAALDELDLLRAEARIADEDDEIIPFTLRSDETEDNYDLPPTLWDFAIAAQKKIVELTQELNRLQEQTKKSEGTQT